MKRKIFIDGTIGEKQILKIEDHSIIERIKKVYKLKPKDTIIFVGQDLIEGIFIYADPKNFIFKKLEAYKRTASPKRKINLYLSFIKKDNFELVLKKSAELGVYKIIPVISERSPWSTNKIPDRWIKIIKSALEVTEWNFIPEIKKPILIKNLPDKIFVLEKSGNIYENSFFDKEEINILIGPEGGFSDKELKLLKEKECSFISLGNITLRTETAIFVILSLLNFPC